MPENEIPPHSGGIIIGADDEVRTRYPHLGKVVLYQMSYIRKVSEKNGSYSETGASGRNRTNDTGIFSPLLYQLSYRGSSQEKWRPGRDSNPRPLA